MVCLNELRLIKRIQRNGDRTAADELIRKYYDAIHGFVTKQVGSADLACDLTQKIFISCLQTIAHYDSKKGASFKTWLYRIASNKVVDYYRSRAYRDKARALHLDDDGAVAEVDALSEADFVLRLENSTFVEEVCTFVACLSHDTQRIFMLHIFGGYTFAEIAKTLGLPEGSVKSIYYRLISNIRKEFANYG